MYLVCERGCNKMKLMNQIDGFALNRLGLVWGFGGLELEYILHVSYDHNVESESL
jgi:hypothetical protein